MGSKCKQCNNKIKATDIKTADRFEVCQGCWEKKSKIALSVYKNCCLKMRSKQYAFVNELLLTEKNKAIIEAYYILLMKPVAYSSKEEMKKTLRNYKHKKYLGSWEKKLHKVINHLCEEGFIVKLFNNKIVSHKKRSMKGKYKVVEWDNIPEPLETLRYLLYEIKSLEGDYEHNYNRVFKKSMKSKNPLYLAKKHSIEELIDML